MDVERRQPRSIGNEAEKSKMTELANSTDISRDGIKYQIWQKKVA